MGLKICDLIQKNQKQKNAEINSGKLACGGLILV